jgi:hypothetical protein
VLIIDIVSAFGAVAGLPWLIEVTEASARYVISRLQVARCRSGFWRGGRHCLRTISGPCDERRHRLPRPLRAVVITGRARLFVLIGCTGTAVGEPGKSVDREMRHRRLPRAAITSVVRASPSTFQIFPIYLLGRYVLSKLSGFSTEISNPILQSQVPAAPSARINHQLWGAEPRFASRRRRRCSLVRRGTAQRKR